jgi:hypothetical protein
VLRVVTTCMCRVAVSHHWVSSAWLIVCAYSVELSTYPQEPLIKEGENNYRCKHASNKKG